MATTKAEEFHALSDTLYHWAVYDPGVKCEIGCTALKLTSGLVLIDPVPLAEAALKELLVLAPLRAILLTNGNHLRATLSLREKYQVPVVTAADTRRDIAELRPDVTLLPNELLYGITAIAIPGATPGETAFFSKTGVMIVGDALINTNTEAGLEFLPDKYCASAEQNRVSLRKLLEYDFHTLTLAHGAPITVQAREKLRALLDRKP
jgi:glyoxylase-like metal-dependent hydrolase (beta-lactamase superfamily II)